MRCSTVSRVPWLLIAIMTAIKFSKAYYDENENATIFIMCVHFGTTFINIAQIKFIWDYGNILNISKRK